MGVYEWPGFIIGSILFIALSYFIAKRLVPAFVERVFYVGVALRFIGVMIYAVVAFAIYKGSADPVIYYRWGVRFSEYFAAFDLAPIFDSSLWRMQRFVGTNFVGYPAAIIVLFTGESFRGSWLVFSFLCFMGLLLFARAFYSAYGGIDYKNYLTFLLLFPPLWFWTASISKDTWVIYGAGIFLIGMVTKSGKQSSIVMGVGFLLVFLVRPQVAAIMALSLAGAYFLLSFRKFNFKNILILVVSIVGGFYALSVLGVGSDVDEVTRFAESQRQYSNYGGSTIQLASGPIAYIMAPINILLRPFPWEISSYLQAITFLEVYFIWYLILRNWKSVKRSFQMIRKDRLVAFSVVFIALFCIGSGLALSNLGLIARQRIILYPFVLILIYAYSDRRMSYLYRKRKKIQQSKPA